MKYLLISFLLLFSNIALAEDEISLYNSRGEAVAYLAMSEDLTVYLWSGEPVSYLKEDISGGK